MDIVCSDFMWSLFIGALNSYKHDSLLRPFPPSFKDDQGEKQFEKLKEASCNISQFDQLNWKDRDKQESINLLKWVINPKRFTLKLGTFAEVQNLVGETDTLTADHLTDFVFEIEYGEQEEAKFTKLKNGMDTFYAYHGSKAENFYSIIQTGLKNNMNKVALFGEGIYLSSDLRVSLTYSPLSKTWSSSLLGDSLSCVAVCEVIDHPIDVKCSLEHSKKSGGSAGAKAGSSQALGNDANLLYRKRSYIQGSEGGKIPDKYYVVRNDDLVRVKYVLVHAPNAQKQMIRRLMAGESARVDVRQGSRLKAFASRHQFAILMLLYAVALALIGVLNSRAFSNWWRERTRNSDDAPFLA